MSYRPRLRAELLREGDTLRDPLTGIGHSLDGIQRQLVEILDGEREVEQILDSVSQGQNIVPGMVERAMRSLLLLGLTEGAGDPIRAQLARARAAPKLEPRVIEGSRFACQGSGDCCRGYTFGPLSDEDVARIEALDVAGKLPHLRDQPTLVMKEWNATRRILHLATVGEQCIFLLPGERCGLHAAFGAEAKPAFCQLFPIQALPTIAGLKVYDRGECSQFAASAQSGPLLVDQLPRLAPLFPCGDLYHPSVTIGERLRCDYGHLLALVDRMDAEVVAAPTAIEALVATARLARGFAIAAASCPIAPRQPDLAVAELLATPLADLPPVGPERHGLAILVALSASLAPPEDGDWGYTAPFRDTLALLGNLARARRRGAALDSSLPDLSSVRLGEQCDSLLRLSLRQQIFGKQLLLDERLPAGILRVALAHAVTLLAARSRAKAEGATRLSPGHLSFGHVIAQRALRRRTPRAILRAHGHHAWSVVAALPSLLGDSA